MRKKIKKLKKENNKTGLQKLARFTSQSISTVYEGYKKNQKAKKLENARMERVSQKKELKLREE